MWKKITQNVEENHAKRWKKNTQNVEKNHAERIAGSGCCAAADIDIATPEGAKISGLRSSFLSLLRRRGFLVWKKITQIWQLPWRGGKISRNRGGRISRTKNGLVMRFFP